MTYLHGRLFFILLLAVAMGSVTLAGCKPDKTAPEDVTNLEATTGDGQVGLTWDASANTAGDLAGYKLYKDGVSIADLGATATGYTATGLTNGTSYAFKVTAFDAKPNESAGATVNAYANPPLGSESFAADSGMADGGVGVGGTQRMTGTVPNPTGSDTAYEGNAYLVINGNRIPLQVTEGTADKAMQYIEKEGVEYPLLDADWTSPDFDWLANLVSEEKEGGIIWIFDVTFSINAGPNTLKIEVYDLDGSLFAATDSWDIVGAIEPQSLVVTLWWDTNKTDIDLHASPDNGTTHCYYANKWSGEMVLDYDDTNGNGPEHITVDDAETTATYKIKVYYYADHNDNEDGSTTPTTCYITADVNGENKLDVSSSLSTESSSSGWQEGAHVWDAGEVEVTSANRLNVTMSAPNLEAYPTVSFTLTVLNPADEGNGVEDLNAEKIYVVNAGTVMRPITVTGGTDGVYTVTFTDITAGKRNLFVYVYAPTPEDAEKADSEQEFMGGLSNTVTYGTNYAVIAGLNEYPAADTTISNWVTVDANTITVDASPHMPTSAGGVAVAGDFSATMTDDNGGTNRAPAAAAVSGISSLGGGSFRLTITRPAANGADYDHVTVKYLKEAWLSYCVNDANDLKQALLNVGSGSSSTMWDSANITVLLNAAATKAAVLDAIELDALLMEPYDAFLFGYAGHGSDGTTSADQYLCTYEDAAWTSVADLQAKLNDIPKPGFVNTLIILDACFSGNFAARGFGADGREIEPVNGVERYRPFIPQLEESKGYGLTFKGLTGSNLFIMTAVDGDHSSFDADLLFNGAFMYYVVEGMDLVGKRLSAAAANTNHDTWVTAEEVYTYAKPKATQYVITNILPSDPGASEVPQVFPNASGRSRLVYCW